MTAIMTYPDRSAQWGSMPGWSVVADLTPPQLVNARRVAALRKWLLLALVLVVLVCVAGYGLAYLSHGRAEDDAASANNDTSFLQHQADRYSGITRIQSITDTTNSQVAQLLSQDVDVPKLAGQIRAALPASMSIQNLTINFTAGSTSGTAGSGTASTPLNTSGLPEIGVITVNGSAHAINDLPTFVDRLSAISGLVSVLPQTDQTASGKAAKTQFSITAAMTNQLLSHQFVSGPTGGK